MTTPETVSDFSGFVFDYRQTRGKLRLDTVVRFFPHFTTGVWLRWIGKFAYEFAVARAWLALGFCPLAEEYVPGH